MTLELLNSDMDLEKKEYVNELRQRIYSKVLKSDDLMSRFTDSLREQYFEGLIPTNNEVSVAFDFELFRFNQVSNMLTGDEEFMNNVNETLSETINELMEEICGEILKEVKIDDFIEDDYIYGKNIQVILKHCTPEELFYH